MGNDQSNRAPVLGYKDTYVEFERQIYKTGGCRLVYMGTFHGDERVEGKRCVVKVNKEYYCLETERYPWQADSLAYEKANEMAKLFNAEYQTSKPIKFVKPEFTTVDHRAAANFLGYQPFGKSKDVPKEVTVAVERFIDGNYEKFVSNAGIMSPKEMATPAAFCHYTYHKTNGEILVCDIQGVRTNTAYILTDPAVHNGSPKPQEYGQSDFGQCGIMKFFGNHKCNVLCKGLNVPQAVNCTTGELSDLKKFVGEIPTGSEDVMGTMLLCNSGVPKEKIEEIQKKIKIKAVSSQ